MRPITHRWHCAEVFDEAGLQSFFPAYPLGTVLTTEEQALIPALEWLQTNTASTSSKLGVLLGAMFAGALPENRAAIGRLGLSQATGLGERIRRRMVRYALARTDK